MTENHPTSQSLPSELHAQFRTAVKLENLVILDYGRAESGQVLAREEEVARSMEDKDTAATLEIWIPAQPCFVLGKYYMKRLEKEKLVHMDRLRTEKIPIVLRASGGEAILHDETCLNFGIIVPRQFFGGTIDMGRMFNVLSSGILSYLEDIRIAAYFGKVKTFCPGPYDILAQGKKIAGLSLLLRKNFCLVHGTLLVNSGKDYFNKLKLFYPAIEEEATSLNSITGIKFDVQDVACEIIQHYKKISG